MSWRRQVRRRSPERVDHTGVLGPTPTGGGVDTVDTTASYVLRTGVRVEVLRVEDKGTTNTLNLTGNEFNQAIRGNNGANLINGGAGAEVMTGFGGNDRYVVDHASDKVIEAANGGTDIVRTTVSYALASGVNVEQLRVFSAASTNNINLTGNAIGQIIVGNNGSNVIAGAGGNDNLTGGAGKDFFLFNTLPNATTNKDIITDFVAAADTIRLENAVFSGLQAGTLAADGFFLGTAAQDAEDRIIYNKATGALLFDADGTGIKAAVQFATLSTKPTISNADFVVV